MLNCAVRSNERPYRGEAPSTRLSWEQAVGWLAHVVQTLARHAEVKLTLKIYSQTNLDAMRQALAVHSILRVAPLLVKRGGRGRFRTCDPSLVSSIDVRPGPSGTVR